MAERRYDEDETRAIFDRASMLPAAPEAGDTLPTGHGFTLAELQEIGAEAGIDPARIAEAARALDVRPAAAPPARRLVGLRVGVARTVDLPGDFGEDDWNRLVVDLRETFDARGRIRVQGAFREWSNGNLQALVEPTEHGHRLRLRTLKGSAYRSLTFGAVMLVVAVVVTLGGLLGGDLADQWVSATILGALGLGTVGFTAARLPGWARIRERQMEEVASRVLLRAGKHDDVED